MRGIFRTAPGSIRKNGKSNIPLLLGELNTHAARIEEEKFQPLITALFSIADELRRKGDGDRGGFSIRNNHYRIHWLCHKLTWGRCSLDERDAIFMTACKTAQLGWLVSFTSSQVTNYYPRDGKEPTPLEKCLVKKGSLPELRTHTINRVSAGAQSGELIHHAELPYILFRWGELAENDYTSVKEWTSEQLKFDEAVSQLAEAFTGESWSHSMGMFGLGDRVAMRQTSALVDGLDRIVDIREFRRRLEEIEKVNSLQDNRKQCVRNLP